MGFRGTFKIEIAGVALFLACSPMKPNLQSKNLSSSTCTSSVARVQSLPKREVHIRRNIEAGQRLNIVLNKVCMGISENRGLQAVEIESSSELTPEDLQDFANESPCIEEISESNVWKTEAVPNDPYYSQQGHLQNLNYSASNDVFFGSNGITTSQQVVIAIVDSGVAIDHPDLRNRLWQNSGEIAGNGRDDDGNGFVDDVNGYNFASDNGNPRPETWSSDPGGEGHGTHVAGLAAAQSNNGLGVAGIAGSNVQIMALNIFGSEPYSNSSYAYNAINYAIDNGADVINLSLSSIGRDDTIGNAIARALSSGIVVVVAAGNDGRELDSSYFVTPASFGGSRPGLITVGASDSATSSKTDFSNFSTTLVEIAAPGSENTTGSQGLLSTFVGTSYTRMAGTSMATPVVAGAAALTIAFLRARGNDPSPGTVENLITTSGRVQAGLSLIKGSKQLDLLSLAQLLNSNYPAPTGGSTGASTGGSGSSTGSTGGGWPPPPCR